MTRRLIVPDETTERPRNNFDALRLGMAMMVIWSHSFAVHMGTESREWVSELLGSTLNAGNVGVMAFFIISGFLINQSWTQSKSLRAFMVKRVRRIYPGYMVATTISSAVMVWYVHGSANALAWGKAIGLNLLLRNYAPVSDAGGHYSLLTVNGALWSIPFEFWCYIALAVLGIACMLTRRWLVVAALVGVALLHVILDALGKKPGLGLFGDIFGWPYLWTKMAPCFLLGMATYAFRYDLPRRRTWLLVLFLATVLGCRINQDLGFILALPSLAYALFYVAFSQSLPLHNAARYGDFSYGTYLYGLLIQKVLEASLGRSWSLGKFFVISAVLSLIAGVISWHLVEKPFLRRKQYRQRSGSASSPRGAVAAK